MAEDLIVEIQQIVVAAIQNGDVAVEIRVVLERVLKGVCAFGIPSQVDNDAPRASGVTIQESLQVGRNGFVDVDAVAERYAAAQHFDTAFI